jgi:uncharacterized protein
LKRKIGDCYDWKRVTQRAYAQEYVETEEFSGYITLLRIDKVAQPLFAQYGTKKVCIADDGYMWLFHYPNDSLHAVTTMFDAAGRIVQWYIDICQGYEVDERGVPFFHDLYLDLIVLSSGEVIQKDSDELEEALRDGVIDTATYQQAWEEARRILKCIQEGTFRLLDLSERHREILVGRL